MRREDEERALGCAMTILVCMVIALAVAVTFVLLQKGPDLREEHR